MTTQHLERPGGRIAYDDVGSGSLHVAAPGMGDRRQVYRHVSPLLTEAGLRLVTMDLRGLGESSPRWDDLSEEAVAADYIALIDELDSGPAVLIGNSLSCASAVIAAVERPELVTAIVLLGPFVRPVQMKWWQTVAFRALLAPPWGRSAWVSYYRKNLYPGPKPPDLDEYAEALSANLSEAGRMASFRSLASNNHEASGSRLPKVRKPGLVIMGTADPDFPDPVDEARYIGEVLEADVLVVDGSGHYPQADSPEAVATAIIDLARRVERTN